MIKEKSILDLENELQNSFRSPTKCGSNDILIDLYRNRQINQEQLHETIKGVSFFALDERTPLMYACERR